MKTWTDILDFPCIVMLAGRRRMGKSALGYYLLTLAQRLYDVDAYVKGLPREKWHLLPDYIHPLSPEDPDLPDGAAIFLDEAAMFYYARDFGTSVNKALSILLSISGQKDQLLIFATHYTRKIDIDIITDVDILAFKQPGMMYRRFERREMRGLVNEVYEKFKALPKDEDRRKYSYVIADTCDYEGFVTNPLPDFWSEELSKAFAGIKVEDVLEMRKGRGGRGRERRLRELWCKFGVEPEPVEPEELEEV